MTASTAAMSVGRIRGGLGNAERIDAAADQVPQTLRQTAAAAGGIRGLRRQHNGLLQQTAAGRKFARGEGRRQWPVCSLRRFDRLQTGFRLAADNAPRADLGRGFFKGRRVLQGDAKILQMGQQRDLVQETIGMKVGQAAETERNDLLRLLAHAGRAVGPKFAGQFLDIVAVDFR